MPPPGPRRHLRPGCAGLATASAPEPGPPVPALPAAGVAAAKLAAVGLAGLADPDAMPTAVRTFPDTSGPPRPGWRRLSRTEPDRYTCSGNSLQIYAPSGGSIVLTREVPRASGS